MLTFLASVKMNAEITVIDLNIAYPWELRFVQGSVNIIGDVNHCTDGSSAIHWAASNIHDNHYLMRKLIAMGANLNSEYNGKTALHRAAGMHKPRIVEELLQHGADIHQTDNAGNTALHHVTFNWGSKEYENGLSVIKALLRNGSNVNARNHKGQTPLISAGKMGHYNIVKPLLEAAADANAIDNFGRTYFHYIKHLEREEEINGMLELVKAGASLRAVDVNGKKPLEMIIYYNPESYKPFIKAALLVDQERTEYYINEFVLDKAKSNEVNYFIDQCYNEAQELRSLSFGEGRTLCDFALRGSENSLKIRDLAYEYTIGKKYEIYDDFILSHFQKDFACAKLDNCAIIANKPMYDVVIHGDVLRLIYKQLTKIDLFNLLRAARMNA